MNRDMGRQPRNARSKGTRSALLKAFATLVQSKAYDALEVADLTTLAGISRSTFYAHYAGMEALLADSIAGPFAVLADAVQPDFDESRLRALLEHFWENRAAARAILAGTARRKAADVLVGLIEDRLKSAGLHRPGAMALPPRLVAIQLAEILLAPITAWLLGESHCSPAALASGLRRSSRALIGCAMP